MCGSRCGYTSLGEIAIKYLLTSDDGPQALQLHPSSDVSHVHLRFDHNYSGQYLINQHHPDVSATVSQGDDAHIVNFQGCPHYGVLYAHHYLHVDRVIVGPNRGSNFARACLVCSCSYGIARTFGIFGVRSVVLSLAHPKYRYPYVLTPEERYLLFTFCEKAFNLPGRVIGVEYFGDVAQSRLADLVVCRPKDLPVEWGTISFDGRHVTRGRPSWRRMRQDKVYIVLWDQGDSP